MTAARPRSIKIRTVSLEQFDKKRFMDFLERDKILNVFTIYDLRHSREKTKAWIALRSNAICAYVFMFEDLFVHTHGATDSVEKLLNHTRLAEPVLVIEPSHLKVVSKIYQSTGPTDASSKGMITKYHVMKLAPSDFSPHVAHNTKRMESKDLDEVLNCLGEEWKKRIETTLSRGIAYGAYADHKLASVATLSEIVDEIALIRGVYTSPLERNKGLAASVCSALVNDLLEKRKTPILWVAEDNTPARRVYEKLGFRNTEIVLLGFKAKRAV